MLFRCAKCISVVAAAPVAVLVLVSLLGTGCVRSRCYGDRDCADWKYCSAGGECVARCTSDASCSSGSYCHASSGRCLDKQCTADGECGEGGHCKDYLCVECLGDEHCTGEEVCYFSKCVTSPAGCECILPPPFCAEDRNPLSGYSYEINGKPLCVPESLENGALLFFGSVG